MRLNDSFHHVRIKPNFNDGPMPSVNKSFSMLLRVEKQRDVQMNFTEVINSAILIQNAKKTGNARN